MNESPKWKVYIKPGCPWCIESTDYLTKHGYTFETIDVTSDPAAFEEMKTLSGQTKAPTMLVNDEWLLADFGVEELVPFLEKHGLSNE